MVDSGKHGGLSLMSETVTVRFVRLMWPAVSVTWTVTAYLYDWVIRISLSSTVVVLTVRPSLEIENGGPVKIEYVS